jgi:hypothetical protein
MISLVSFIGVDCYNFVIDKSHTLLDKLALAYCCKDHYKFLNKKLLSGSRAIENYMKKNGYKYENFTARLSPECIIYGGFIFHVLMNTHDERSDVDIIHYMEKDGSYLPIKTLTVNRGCKNTFSATYDDCDQYLISDNGTGMFMYLLNHIKEDGSSNDGLHYQHLTLLRETPSLKYYLNKTCDLNVTKNYYDPKTDRIYIYSLDKLWERKDEADPIISYNKRFAHYNYDEQWCIDQYYEHYDHILSRIQKYKERGMNITLLNKYNSQEYLKHLSDVYHLADITISPYPLIHTTASNAFPIVSLNYLILNLNLETKTLERGTEREKKISENYYSNFVAPKILKMIRKLGLNR